MYAWQLPSFFCGKEAELRGKKIVMFMNGKIVTNAIRLSLMNRLVWEQEHEARKCMKAEREMSQEELVEQGKINVRVRDFNRKRVEYKNELNGVGKGFKEAKLMHRSC